MFVNGIQNGRPNLIVILVENNALTKCNATTRANTDDSMSDGAICDQCACMMDMHTRCKNMSPPRYQSDMS